MDVATMAELSCRVVRLHCRALRPAADEEGHQHTLSIPLSTPCSLPLALGACTERGRRAAMAGSSSSSSFLTAPSLLPSLKQAQHRLPRHTPTSTRPSRAPLTVGGAWPPVPWPPQSLCSWPGHHGLPLAAPSPSSDAPESELAPLPPLTAGDPLLAGDRPSRPWLPCSRPSGLRKEKEQLCVRFSFV
jgi:hypothetical protein